ncbi:MAG: transglutaminaseTgpA domain-containing protein [Actinomycetota bacterium]
MKRDWLTGLLAAAATAAAVWSLTPLVRSTSWLVPSSLVVIIVLLTGALARQLRTPAGYLIPLQFIAGLVLLAVFFTTDLGNAILSPTALWVEMRDLLSDGVQVIDQRKAPLPETSGLSLLLALGVLMVSILVDAMVVTVRAPAASGLPLLALMSIPGAVLDDGVSWYSFVATATVWLLILAYDTSQRWQRWGHAPTDTALHARAGRRTAILALGGALLVPAIAPGPANGILDINRGGPDQIQNRTVINPILTLRDNLTRGEGNLALTYRSTTPDTPPLRLITADVFTGELWQPALQQLREENRVANGIPSPPGLAAATPRIERKVDITIAGLDQEFLPLPYPTSNVNVNGTWFYDPDTLSVIGEDGQTTRGLSYSVSYLNVQPTTRQLRAASNRAVPTSSRFTELPPLPESIGAQAEEVVAGAANDYERATALQRWFRTDGGFEYTTEVVDTAGENPVATFLQDRRGYCVQYASAMAVMARHLKIPARVAVGFLPGDPAGNDQYRVEASKAHAWPELYFNDVGWVRFEPTPAIQSGNAPAYTVEDSDPEPTPTESSPSSSSSASSESSTASGTVSPESSVAPEDDDTGTVSWSTWTLVGLGTLVAALAALLIVPAIGWFARSRRRKRAASQQELIEAFWQDLHEFMDDLDVDLGNHLTPRQLQRRLITDHHLGAGSQVAMARLATVTEDVRYGRPTTTTGDTSPPLDISQLQEDLGTIVREVKQTRPKRRQLVARWFPRSGRSHGAQGIKTAWLRVVSALNGAESFIQAGRVKRDR